MSSFLCLLGDLLVQLMLTYCNTLPLPNTFQSSKGKKNAQAQGVHSGALDKQVEKSSNAKHQGTASQALQPKSFFTWLSLSSAASTQQAGPRVPPGCMQQLRCNLTRTHGAIPRNMRDATQEGFSASFWQLCYKRSLKWFGLGSYIWVVAEGNGPRPHLSQELENTPLKNLLLINLQSLLTCPNTQKMKFCKWQCSRLVPAYHPVKNQYREQQRAALTQIQTLETLKPD